MWCSRRSSEGTWTAFTEPVCCSFLKSTKFISSTVIQAASVLVGVASGVSAAADVLLQAQTRMQESSQKVDLLRVSLERRLSELPPDHPRHAAVQEELSSLASPSRSTPRKPSSHSSSSSTTSTTPSSTFSSTTSSSLFKPASLTGCCHTLELYCTSPVTTSSTIENNRAPLLIPPWAKLLLPATGRRIRVVSSSS